MEHLRHEMHGFEKLLKERKMQDRNNIQNNKSQVSDKDQKNKSNVDQKSRTPNQTDRDRQSTDRR